jgi:hypothetical protein
MAGLLNILHVSDESGVAPALADALGDRAYVRYMRVRQAGAKWPSPLKPLAVGARWREARRVRRAIERMTPRPDILHIHWLPNGLVGTMGGAGRNRIPWVLHLHGSDIRDIGGWRALAYSRIIRAADAVVFSTPDLGPHVHRWRPNATFLPTPVHLPLPSPQLSRWDVFAASEALPVKGSAKAFAVLRRIATDRPELRLAALEGKSFEAGAWERMALSDKDTFHNRLASSEVVLGQLKLGAAGLVELEAMALGRPVVGWINRELYADAPPIVSVQDPGDLARATLELLSQADRRRDLGQRGRLWVSRHHDPESIAVKLLDIYRGISVVRD